MNTETLPQQVELPVVADDDSLTHATCCRHSNFALCGTHDDVWYESAHDTDCVVCLYFENDDNACLNCPIDGGVCELYA